MRNFCELVYRDTDLIIGRWEAMTHDEPWVLLPSRDRTDHLPQVLLRIADLGVCSPPTRAAASALARDAATHGERRAKQGLPDHVILTEFHLLRGAIWAYFQLNRTDDQADYEIMHRVDIALSLASRASMLGYHRPQLVESGRWPDVLDDVINEAPFLYGVPATA